MMAAFRAFAKSPWAIALFGVLIISFGVVFNVRDMFRTSISDWVVSAGSRQLSSNEFKRVFDDQLRNIQQRSGQSVTAQDAAAQGMDRQLLQALVQQETLREAMRRSGIEPSAQLVLQELRKIPAFFNPITGNFDQQAYQRLLAERVQRTPAEFEADLKQQIAEQH